ncbi:MAG: 4Fe-4S dicluster domain-containing protein [Betaproteobacteria bacterium]|nr:4Fe-4S dicluster domain-containing protein [Betaproteobacteria bacterium]
MSEVNKERRQLLGAGAAVASLVVAPGVFLVTAGKGRADEEAGEAGPQWGKVRWGMLVDTAKCSSGCTQCVSACDKENHLSGETLPTSSQWIRKMELTDRETGKSYSLPMMCQHCDNAPCVDVCPTGASFKRWDGIVSVDRHLCIGCRYCLMACPYKARSFVHHPVTDQNPDVPRGQGCAESCDFCKHRIDEGQIPACVEACGSTGGGALLFGDLNDPKSEISQRVATIATLQVRADLGTEPAVRYEGIL